MIKYRSNYERIIARSLELQKVEFEYEPIYIFYQVDSKYTPDFILSNGIIVEAKGYFTPKDRGKHLLIKKQHPEKDIRFVFQNAKVKLSKKSKTTYGEWCDNNEFKWAQGVIPVDWINESS